MTHRNTTWDLSVFVVMTFLAVFLRRFGIPFFFYGFMSWIGYLFASLLGATFSILPMILLALAIGTAWVLLLSLTMLSISPARILNLTLQAFHARVRTIVAVCADLADVHPRDAKEFGRWRSRLDRQQRRLSEAALMIEAASGEHEALPAAEAGRRRRLRGGISTVPHERPSSFSKRRSAPHHMSPGTGGPPIGSSRPSHPSRHWQPASPRTHDGPRTSRDPPASTAPVVTRERRGSSLQWAFAWGTSRVLLPWRAR